MPKKSRRQVFTRKKRRQIKNAAQQGAEISLIDVPEETAEENTASEPAIDVQEPPATYTLVTFQETSSSVAEVPTAALLTTGLRKLSCILPSDWVPTADTKGFYILRLSPGDVKAVQRQIFIAFSGQASVHIHCQPCPLFDETLSLLYSPKIFSLDSMDEFCQSVLSLVEIVLQYTVCIGIDNEEAKRVQENIPTATIDSNQFFESSYIETCRSLSCTRLVPLEDEEVRCEACTNLLKWIRERLPDES